MEQFSIYINEPDRFDAAVHGDGRVKSLPSGDRIELITKDDGTESGRGAAVITFFVDVDGVAKRAQFTTTIRNLRTALEAVAIAYDDDGRPRPGVFGRPA